MLYIYICVQLRSLVLPLSFLEDADVGGFQGGRGPTFSRRFLSPAATFEGSFSERMNVYLHVHIGVRYYICARDQPTTVD